MPARMRLWVSLLGIWVLLPGNPVRAQGRVGCLRPIQSPGFMDRVAPPLPDRDAGEGVYLDEGGRLCGRFSPGLPAVTAMQSMEDRAPTPGRAFLLSSLLPGMGQRMLGQDRWVAYMAAEIWAWAQYLERRREGRRLQKGYRDLAWLVARRVSIGRRVDGNFEYYESMTEFRSSGAYDLAPEEAGVQPETDRDTFNGFIWELAREIYFLDDPEALAEERAIQYEKAIRYYLSRAITPTLAWNWSDNDLQQAEFAELIRESDENLRRGTTMIGLILANHLLSAVDALVTGRLLQEEESDPHLDLALLPGPFGRDVFALSVRIPTR